MESCGGGPSTPRRVVRKPHDAPTALPPVKPCRAGRVRTRLACNCAARMAIRPDAKILHPGWLVRRCGAHRSCKVGNCRSQRLRGLSDVVRLHHSAHECGTNDDTISVLGNRSRLIRCRDAHTGNHRYLGMTPNPCSQRADMTGRNSSLPVTPISAIP